MKKRVRAALMLGASLLLGACGNGSDEIEEATRNADADTITMWVQFSAEDAEGQVLEKAIQKFNETNEDGLTAEVQYIPRSGSGGGYEDKLNAALTTDSLPDVFTLDGPNNAAYANAGMLQPLDGKLSNMEDFLPSIIKQGTYEGKLYSIGYSESGVGIYYNIDQLEAAGIKQEDLPTVENPWTWDEFNAMLAKLKANNDGKPVFNMGLDDNSEWLLYGFSPFLWSNGGEIVNEDATKAIGVFDSKENVETFEFIQSLLKNGYSTVSPIDKGFQTGQYPLLMSGSWTMQELDNEYPDINYGIMPYPVSPRTKELVSPTGSWAYGLSATSDNPEGAAKLIDFLTNEENLYQMAMGNSVLPARQSVADRMLEEVSEPMTVLIEQNTASGKARPVLKRYAQVSRAFQQTVIESTYYEENPEIQPLLDVRAEEIERYLQ